MYKSVGFALTETKLFQFHRIFKNGAERGCEPPLDEHNPS